MKGSKAAFVRLVLMLVVAFGAYLYFLNPGTRSLARLFPPGGTGPDLLGLERDPGPRILGLEPKDRQQLQQQRELVDELALRYVGRTLARHSLRELDAIQTIVDRAGLTADQTYELQALGVALGDVMSRQLALDWVAFEDKLGRSRALRYRRTDQLFFPVTMISKRIEAGVEVDVRQLFERARAQVDALQPGARRRPIGQAT